MLLTDAVNNQLLFFVCFLLLFYFQIVIVMPSKKNDNSQGFIQDFQFGGGDVACGLTGMGEHFSQVTPRNGAKSIVVSFC